ncbi:hypothetical protein EON65_57820 [archaeon]|nr:MAG: hypothetical protein EON65_57820 [archaeon]
MVLDYMWSKQMAQKINELYESLPNRMQAVMRWQYQLVRSKVEVKHGETFKVVNMYRSRQK